MKSYCFVIFLVTTTFPSFINTLNEWSDPSKAQFHIQTDEGPERYFKYQTLSGQYRKERRLEDGTVIGSYAWVDGDGYLRMSEYISDNEGYRILKNKNVFVGRSRPISEALVIAKKAPADSGTLVNAVPKATVTPTPFVPQPVVSTVPQNNLRYNGPNSVKSYPIGYSYEHLQQPEFKYATYSVEPQRNTFANYAPAVEVSPNAIPSSTEAPIRVIPAIPSSTVLPPEYPSSTPLPPISSTTPATVYIPSTTPASSHNEQSSYSSTPVYPSSTANYNSPTPIFRIPSTSYGSPVPSTFRHSTPLDYYRQNNYVSTLPPPISSNSIDSSFYSSDPQYEHYPDDQSFVNPYIYQNGPTYPIDNRGNTYNGNIGNGYRKQFPLYDGVSVTNDGFRYYIPKQYHEEQNLPNNEKSGSFGYVDPFGIRRVIYYNAGPDGFKHRKNNRYVGLNGTPYDPRPY